MGSVNLCQCLWARSVVSDDPARDIVKRRESQSVQEPRRNGIIPQRHCQKHTVLKPRANDAVEPYLSAAGIQFQTSLYESLLSVEVPELALTVRYHGPII